jgi:hypothetical protein
VRLSKHGSAEKAKEPHLHVQAQAVAPELASVAHGIVIKLLLQTLQLQLVAVAQSLGCRIMRVQRVQADLEVLALCKGFWHLQLQCREDRRTVVTGRPELNLQCVPSFCLNVQVRGVDEACSCRLVLRKLQTIPEEPDSAIAQLGESIVQGEMIWIAANVDTVDQAPPSRPL